MKLEIAEQTIAHLRDHIATKPPSVTGRKMFDAIQTILQTLASNRTEIDRLQKLVIHVRTQHWDGVRALACIQGAESLDGAGVAEACAKWVHKTRKLLREWKPEAADAAKGKEPEA